jgi:Uma2 family endonuclease
MSSAVLDPVAAPLRATTADLLAQPDDGVERWLVDGKIKEVGMTIRNGHHTFVESEVVYHLQTWRKALPRPNGRVHSGEVGVTLREEPSLTVGVDVVYLNGEQAARNPPAADGETTILVGPITLAVEILSPSDTIENIHRKLRWFAACGVPVAWVLHPYQRTVAIHRPGVPPVTLNEQQELDGGAELPGFRVTVGRLFEE